MSTKCSTISSSGLEHFEIRDNSYVSNAPDHFDFNKHSPLHSNTSNHQIFTSLNNDSLNIKPISNSEGKIKFINSSHFIGLMLSVAAGSFGNPLIVDLRENRLFQNRRIKNSINANCHSKLMAKRSIQAWLKNPLDLDPNLSYIVYVFDEKTCAPSKEQTGSVGQNLLLFAQHLVQQNNIDVFIIDGGWQSIYPELEKNAVCVLESSIEKDLLDRYTQSPTATENPNESILNATASRINEQIYLGNERDSKDIELVTSLGISHILNVTHNLSNYFQEHPHEIRWNIKYSRLAASDSHHQDLLKFFDQSFEFIEEAIKDRKARVLIHCWAGVSRSATIMIAYLQRKLSLSVEAALELVTAQRPIVAPNLNFIGQLHRYSDQLLALRRSDPATGVQMLDQCSGNTTDLPTGSFSSNDSGFEAGDDLDDEEEEEEEVENGEQELVEKSRPLRYQRRCDQHVHSSIPPSNGTTGGCLSNLSSSKSSRDQISCH